MNPADVFDFENFEPFWFISPELSDLFNIKESSEVSRSSRGLSQTHGHYLIRREATEEDHETISRIYTYLYRPASFEEKARDLSNSFGWDANKLAQESDYSAYEIQQILDKPDEEIEPLNPFDTTQHKGEVNFAAVETYLRDKFEDFSLETTDLAETTSHQVTATHIPYPTYPYPSYTDRSEPQYVDQTPVEPATYYYPNPQTEADPVMPSELVLRVEAILSYASEVGRKVEVSTLVAATNSTIKDVLTALSEVDPGLLERTI